jgi:hypothetical protein
MKSATTVGLSFLAGGVLCLLVFWALHTVERTYLGGGIDLVRFAILVSVGVGSAAAGILQAGVAPHPVRFALLLNLFVWALSAQQLLRLTVGLGRGPGTYEVLENPFRLLETFLTLKYPVLLPPMFFLVIAASVLCHWRAICWRQRVAPHLAAESAGQDQ